MKDFVGRKLLAIRKKNVLPLISGSLLDIGCGTNEIVKLYKRKETHEAIGVDVYPWEGVNVVVKDSSKLPFESKHFDTVLCIATLNHIPNRDKVIDEMARVLKDSGKIIITMIPPGISNIWHHLRSPWDADQHERGMAEGELYGFTAKEIVSLFDTHGLKLIMTKSFMLGINKIYIFKKKSAEKP